MIHMNSSIVDGSIDQVGVVVQDARKVAEQLSLLLGAGPFRLMEYPIPGVDAQAIFRGAPAEYRVLLAFGQLGATQVELVQPLEGESIWGEYLEKHGPGLHHFRVTVSNFDETVQAWQDAGIENIASGTGAHVGSRWAYFDTSAQLDGIVIELRKRMDETVGEGQWAGEGVQLGGEQPS
jgi:methylmalonyl-CoA/ethylmalonyl-CoA epimerase